MRAVAIAIAIQRTPCRGHKHGNHLPPSLPHLHKLSHSPFSLARPCVCCHGDYTDYGESTVVYGPREHFTEPAHEITELRGLQKVFHTQNLIINIPYNLQLILLCVWVCVCLFRSLWSCVLCLGTVVVRETSIGEADKRTAVS